MMYRFQDPEELSQHKREPLLDFKQHYDFIVGMALRGYDHVARGVAKNGSKANKTDPEYSSRPEHIEAALMTGTRRRSWDALEHLLISYSAGNPIDELREFYPTLLGYWEEFAKYHVIFHECPDANGRRVTHLGLSTEDFAKANALICMALLLGWAEFLPQLARILDYENDVHDILLETYFSSFISGRPEGEKYIRYLPYRKLQKVFDAKPDKRPALMAKYMDEWYEASRREPYHGMHEEIKFTGYWAWEAAAITWLFEIDDSSYRDKLFYPAELVDYARAQYTPAQARIKVPKEIPPPKPDGPMRVEGGEQCPREGWWWSPADKESPRFFRRGEVTPIITSSTWGQSYWLWQGEGTPDK